MAFLRVGYWRPLGGNRGDDPRDYVLPDPRTLVDVNWDSDVRSRIASYLKNGKVLAYGFDYSYCRFRCGVSDTLMGSCDLTDGVWIWPEGLHHYVEIHSVRLQNEFINHMRSHDFHPPSDLADNNLHDAYGDEKRHTASELYERFQKSNYGGSF